MDNLTANKVLKKTFEHLVPYRMFSCFFKENILRKALIPAYFQSTGVKANGGGKK